MQVELGTVEGEVATQVELVMVVDMVVAMAVPTVEDVRVESHLVRNAQLVV